MRQSDNDKRELADRYQAVVARVSAILFKQDPIGIAEETLTPTSTTRRHDSSSRGQRRLRAQL